MLRDVTEERAVTETLKEEAKTKPRVWDVWNSLSWHLAHEHKVNSNPAEAADHTISYGARVFYLMKRPATVIGYASVSILYTLDDPHRIVVHAIRFATSAPSL
jgi:hypothetical protein